MKTKTQLGAKTSFALAGFLIPMAHGAQFSVHLVCQGGPTIDGIVDTAKDEFRITAWVDSAKTPRYRIPALGQLPLTLRAYTASGARYDLPDAWNGQVGFRAGFGFFLPGEEDLTTMQWIQGPATRSWQGASFGWGGLRNRLGKIILGGPTSLAYLPCVGSDEVADVNLSRVILNPVPAPTVGALTPTNPAPKQLSIAAFETVPAGGPQRDVVETKPYVSMNESNRLALALRDQGKYVEATVAFRAILTNQQRVLGPENPETLATRNNIIETLLEQGKHTEAQTECFSVLPMMQEVLGPEHRETLKCRTHRATLLCVAQGKCDEAEMELRKVLAISERVLGPEHLETLDIQDGLARVLALEGNAVLAEAKYRSVIRVRERVLGPEHRDSLRSRALLAVVLQAQHKLNQAEAENRAVLTIRQRILGSEHPDTLSSLANLAGVLCFQGRYAESEPLLRAAITTEERVLGPETPDTLRSRANLVEVLRSQGKYAQAEAEGRAVLSIYERVLSPGHTEIGRVCYNLALSLGGQTNNTAALEFARRALSIWQKSLGQGNFFTEQASELVRRLETQK
jgi:tetratricopeptide (TPR) repeat protein